MTDWFKKICAANNDDKGFSLIELLVVMVILGMLAALVGPKLFGHVDKAKQHDASTQISMMGEALDLYRLEKHHYPTTSDGLEAIRSYLKKDVPKDPWGNNYIYTAPGQHGDYDLSSLGADGQEGGEGINQDITSWGSLKKEE